MQFDEFLLFQIFYNLEISRIIEFRVVHLHRISEFRILNFFKNTELQILDSFI